MCVKKRLREFLTFGIADLITTLTYIVMDNLCPYFWYIFHHFYINTITALPEAVLIRLSYIDQSSDTSAGERFVSFLLVWLLNFQPIKMDIFNYPVNQRLHRSLTRNNTRSWGLPSLYIYTSILYFCFYHI